jgi:ligand-binding sensor domain-containing protein
MLQCRADNANRRACAEAQFSNRAIERNNVKKAVGLLGIVACLSGVPDVYAQDSAGAPAKEELPDISEDRIRVMLQDAAGNFWFGGNGMYRHDGDSLEYFKFRGGYGGAVAKGIAEDEEGNVWFGMYGGVTKYDGKSFTTFTEDDGLNHNDVWSITIDSKGTVWIGTFDGACRFDGKTFTHFPIPPAKERDYNKGVWSPTRVMCITEDRAGNMWFAAEGGVFKYDGEHLSRFPVMDGQSDVNVSGILEGKNGNIWFGTSYNGVIRFDGEVFTNVTKQEGLLGTETSGLYEDKSGNIWFSVEGFGVYRYDGKSFTNFHDKEGLTNNVIHSFAEDRDGRLWAGGYLGLYRLDGERFVQVSNEGPW